MFEITCNVCASPRLDQATILVTSDKRNWGGAVGLTVLTKSVLAKLVGWAI